MIQKKEIFIKLNNLKEVIELLKSIEDKEKVIKSYFNKYDTLNFEENKIFENWENYLDEMKQKLNYIVK